MDQWCWAHPVLLLYSYFSILMRILETSLAKVRRKNSYLQSLAVRYGARTSPLYVACYLASPWLKRPQRRLFTQWQRGHICLRFALLGLVFFMTRPLRIEFAGALYHVTSRGNQFSPDISGRDRNFRIRWLSSWLYLPQGLGGSKA